MRRSAVNTPKSDRGDVNYPKTPYNIRARVRKKLTELESSEEGDSDSDFKISESDASSTNSDVTPSSSEDELESKSTNSSDSDVELIEESEQVKKFETVTIKNSDATKTRRIKKYVVDVEKYFTFQSSSKSITSNNTLDKLKNLKLDQGNLQKIIQKSNARKHHTKHFEELKKHNESHFTKWFLLLQEGFNLLLYGLGSKKNLLVQFQEQFLTDDPVIVVNGFFPSLTLKNILDSILVDVLQSRQNPSNNRDACDVISDILSQNKDMHLYLIINNIDGSNLRNAKSQNVLASLASISNFHLIATIDHISAPIVWSQNKLSKFNFLWFDVTNFEFYINETCFEDSMMVQRSKYLALSSLNNVFSSLTKNAKNIYLIIVKYQLENKKNQHYEGILFKDLYWSCREAFLVSSDLALRAQLTEFVDHRMIKFKRSISGGELLIIPLQNTLLQQFLDEQST